VAELVHGLADCKLDVRYQTGTASNPAYLVQFWSQLVRTGL